MNKDTLIVLLTVSLCVVHLQADTTLFDWSNIKSNKVQYWEIYWQYIKNTQENIRYIQIKTD